ncbi:hypothetical protein J4229_02510 [Candidatus Pacearchaeota archaeon]|nr:hypothetical protein [Candidatus Pacearchaeota archaeon]
MNKTTNKIWNKLKITSATLVGAMLAIPGATAHCPLCTGATIFGVGVTRAWHWDDSIVGIFVGAMIVSSALWLNNIMKKRNIGGNSTLRIASLTLATLILTALSFYYAGLIGPANDYRIFGIEKIVFGTFSGGVISFAAFWISNILKKRNNGKVLFNYQTMAITFAALILNSLIFWAIFR